MKAPKIRLKCTQKVNFDVVLNICFEAGRASYTSAQQQTRPDAGAIALALIFQAIFDEYSKSIY